MGKELETYKKCLKARRKRQEAREGGKKCRENPNFFAPLSGLPLDPGKSEEEVIPEARLSSSGKFLFVDALSRASSFPVSNWSYRVRAKPQHQCCILTFSQSDQKTVRFIQSSFAGIKDSNRRIVKKLYDLVDQNNQAVDKASWSALVKSGSIITMRFKAPSSINTTTSHQSLSADTKAVPSTTLLFETRSKPTERKSFDGGVKISTSMEASTQETKPENALQSIGTHRCW